jgi:formylglycine-generating enzyme required for sulfatase activity
MSRTITILAALALMASPARAQNANPLCPGDSVPVGTVCMDKFEVSVWRVPNPTTTNAGLVTKIRQGKATAADLLAGGATQRGAIGDNYAPCTDNGQNCTNDLYAVSLPSVLPSAFITWFQAQEACANSGKRLPTSAEWQMAANGTPDPGPDNGTTSPAASRSWAWRWRYSSPPLA